MGNSISSFSFLRIFALTFAAIIIGVIFLPNSRYYRWQTLETDSHRKADWVFERLHYDDYPIDVAMIGTSRLAGGISGPDLEAGYCRLTGRTIRVANLSLPATGRSLQYVVMKELAKTKKPQLTLIEINEMESRIQHVGFKKVADVSDFVTAPLFINLNYPRDLANLPGRQVNMFFDTILKRPNVRPEFDPAAYAGHDLDNTREVTLINGSIESRMIVMPIDELERGHRRRHSPRSKMHLRSYLKPLEYRASRIYLRRMEAFAETWGGDTAYLFVPAYKEPKISPELLSDLGIDDPIIDIGGDIAFEPEKWRDETHVNTVGAMEQTQKLVELLAKSHPTLGEDGCARDN